MEWLIGAFIIALVVFGALFVTMGREIDSIINFRRVGFVFFAFALLLLGFLLFH